MILSPFSDYSIMQQNFIPKMIMSFGSSSLCPESTKAIVLSVIFAICQIPSAALDMIKNHGLLLWLMTLNDYKSDLLSVISKSLAVKAYKSRQIER